MHIEIKETTTDLETTTHLDSLFAEAKAAYEDWGVAQGDDNYEAGRAAYESAHNDLQVALGEAWDLPDPELDPPMYQIPEPKRPQPKGRRKCKATN